jgi:putative inorganic carbon (HCO3(-)) transporter
MAAMADPRTGALRPQRAQAEAFAHKATVLWLPVLYFLISSLFYLRTYDSAQVKITMMQMGGLGLFALWLCRLALAGRAAFNKQDLICLSPFLAYLAVGVFSFLHAPYRMASVDFFLRHMFYMVVALVAIYELDQHAVSRLFDWLIWTAWVAVGYGTLQFVDVHAFPLGIGKGIDPFVWRGAFGTRVFSTYGNPNFYGDFLVIVFPILLMQFLKTRRWSLLPLMAMLLLNLLATGTKGAWVGFGIVCALFGVVALTSFREQSRPWRVPILGAALVGVLGLMGYTAYDLHSRMASINFRLFTWEATWEMIETHPGIGSGVGAFPPLYPAFRRPPIFHIEGKHNTETDHAEDEYLEELLDHGILGAGIFLWLILSTLVVGFRSLGQLTTSLALKDGRPPPRAYDLAGLLVSLCGMLTHNFFDVSLRFVSSGVYLGLLSGLIVNVARGRALYELHESRPSPRPLGFGLFLAGCGMSAYYLLGLGQRGTLALIVLGGAVFAWELVARLGEPAAEADPEPAAWRSWALWAIRLATIAFLAWVALGRGYQAMPPTVPFGGMFGEFYSLTGPLTNAMNAPGGELLQWWLAWLTFAGCMAFLGVAMARLCLLSESPIVPTIVLVILQPLTLFWGYFRADIHHNLAIYFSKDRDWEPAIAHYTVVNKLNPDFVMAKYFMGNVFADRFNMAKVSMPQWGDPGTEPIDDYERALYWYNEVRRLSPNYVQTHHQVGTLHLRRAQWAAENHRPQEEVDHYIDLAMNRFRLYEQIDPVYAPNYYQIAQIYVQRKQYDAAIRTYEDLIRADACAVEPKLLANDFLRGSILSYQPYVKEDGVWVHRHATMQDPRESAETYTRLADAHFLAHQADPRAPGHLEGAAEAYRRALGFDPTVDRAAKNLQIVYKVAQNEGRLRTVPPPAQKPAPGEPPFTGYEVAPK